MRLHSYAVDNHYLVFCKLRHKATIFYKNQLGKTNQLWKASRNLSLGFDLQALRQKT
jgi:hypothetical protein